MQFSTTPRRTYSKIISRLNKLTPGISIQHSTTRIEEAEQGIDAHENTSTDPESSMVELQHSSAYTMKKYHHQRSTKIPLREPAQFPISQSFSQRVIIESDGDKPDDKIVNDAYPTTHQQNSNIPTKSDPSTRRQVSTSRLERAIKDFVPWRNKKSMTVRERAEVSKTNGSLVAKGTPIHKWTQDVGVHDSSSLFTKSFAPLDSSLPPGLTHDVRSTDLSHQTPFIIHDPNFLMTSSLTLSLHTPSTIDLSSEHES